MRAALSVLVTLLVVPAAAGSWATLFTAPTDASLQRTSCLSDGEHAWTVGREPDGLRIYRTEDGWETWAGNPIFDIPYGLALDLQFVTEEDGWLSGNAPCLWRTDNGGETWEVEECTNGSLDVGQVGSLRMEGPTCGFAAVTESERPGENRRVLSYGGPTRGWRRLKTRLGFVPEGIFAVNKLIWLTGEPGQALRSTDAETWVPMNIPGSWLVRDIFFIDEDYGWMCGDKGRIVHTRDGGRTWVRQESRVPEADDPDTGRCGRVEAIAFRSRLEGCAVTLDYGVRVTSDGGKRWRDVGGPVWERVVQHGQYVDVAQPCHDVDPFVKGFLVTSDHGVYRYTGSVEDPPDEAGPPQILYRETP